jgi:hypothetical protein
LDLSLGREEGEVGWDLQAFLLFLCWKSLGTMHLESFLPHNLHGGHGHGFCKMEDCGWGGEGIGGWGWDCFVLLFLSSTAMTGEKFLILLFCYLFAFSCWRGWTKVAQLKTRR